MPKTDPQTPAPTRHRPSTEEVAVRAVLELADYMTPAQLRRESSGRYGLEYTEALEMAYENMLSSAKTTAKFLRRRLKPKKVSNA